MIIMKIAIVIALMVNPVTLNAIIVTIIPHLFTKQFHVHPSVE